MRNNCYWRALRKPGKVVRYRAVGVRCAGFFGRQPHAPIASVSLNQRYIAWVEFLLLTLRCCADWRLIWVFLEQTGVLAWSTPTVGGKVPKL